MTLTAATSPAGGGRTVSLTSNGHAILGTPKKTLTPAGKTWQAACKTTALPPGTDTLKAAYGGDTEPPRDFRRLVAGAEGL